MASRAIIPFLVTMMLVTGVCNTILNKYQDMQCVRDCDSPDPKARKTFEQPVIQTAQMFIGEMGCWIVLGLTTLYQRFVAPRLSGNQSPLLTGGYRPVRGDDGDIEDDVLDGLDPSNPANKPDDVDRIPLRGWRILLLAAPSTCDLTGTTLMNVGLLFVAASIYQMTRGALVLFVGLFSVLFLRRKLYLYQWGALFIVVSGVAVVGLSGVLFGGSGDDGSAQNTDASYDATEVSEAVRAFIGVLLIAAAQIFTASQFVLEEWILENYEMDPMEVVGWEGVFGFSVTLIGMLLGYAIVGRTDAGRYGYFDLKEGMHEVFTNRAVAVSSVLIMISIGGFNFFGLSVTRNVSATSRSTIDTCRTLFIWLVSLGLGWESFKWLQVVGFGLLVYGTFLFNDIVQPPLKACLPPPEHTEHEALLPEEPIDRF